MLGLDSLCQGPLCDIGINRTDPTAFDRFIQSQAAGVFIMVVQAARKTSVNPGAPPPTPICGSAICDIPFVNTTGGLKDFIFSDTEWDGRPRDLLRPNTPAIPAISSTPDIDRQIPLMPEDERRGDATTGAPELINFNYLDDFAVNWSIGDRPIRFYRGAKDDDFGSLRLIHEVYGDDIIADLNSIRVNVKSTASYLNKPFHYRKYGGTGGLDGDLELAGTIVPVCYGIRRNITPVMINRGYLIYQFHDSPSLAVDKVRDKGVELDFDADYPTLTALINAVIPAGGYATCLTFSLIRLASPAEGKVTAAVRGDNDTLGYTARTGDILLKIALQRAGMGSDNIQQETFGQLPTGAIGFYSGQQEYTCAEVFNLMLAGVWGYYGSERSKAMRVGYIQAPEELTSSMKLEGELILDLEQVSMPKPPRYEQSVIYRTNDTPMSEDEVSLSLSSSERAELLAKYPKPLTQESLSALQRDKNAIVGGDITTLFDEAEDAAFILSNIMNFLKVPRRMFEVTLPRVGYTIRMQQCVTLKYERYDLQAGKKFLVLGVRDSYQNDQVVITVAG